LPFSGVTKLYQANRKPGPIVEAACWAHGRRKFFDLARLSKAPIAAEAVKRIDALFAIEREISGLMPQERLRVRQERSRSLIIELQTWLREQRARLSKNSDTTKAINYSLNRWDAFTRFLEDGRLCRELAAQFLALAEKQKATIPRMIGHRITGTSLSYTGDIVEGRAHLDHALALYDPVEQSESRMPEIGTFGLMD
jgi:Transposase IS66 family